jgi:hypothetical protein
MVLGRRGFGIGDWGFGSGCGSIWGGRVGIGYLFASQIYSALARIVGARGYLTPVASCVWPEIIAHAAIPDRGRN